MKNRFGPVASLKTPKGNVMAIWSPPLDMLNDNQQVVCYTMPVLDENGNGYGVVGIEIDMPYFAQHYLPDSDLLYHNSFYVIAGMKDQTLDLDWFIPSGVLAETYLKKRRPAQTQDWRRERDFRNKTGRIRNDGCLSKGIEGL